MRYLHLKPIVVAHLRESTPDKVIGNR